MGRKRKSDEPRATPSRSSARLASKPKIEEPEEPEAPTKSTPKQKRSPRKKQGDQLNDSEIVSNESPNKSAEEDKGDVSDEDVEQPVVVEKKQKKEPPAKKSKIDKTANSSEGKSTNLEDSEDFVMVKASDVPAPESKEVKEAIKAQGEDAELLVNVVQISKDEVPSADSEEVAKSVPEVPESAPEAEANHDNEKSSSAEQENGSVSADDKTSPVVKDNGVVEAMDTSPSKLCAVSDPDAPVAASNCTTNDNTT